MRIMSLAAVAAATAALSFTACSHEAKKTEAAAPAASTPAAAPTASPVKSESAKAASATKVECSVKGDNRILEARAHGKGCDLAYTKAGKEGTVASASNGTAYCEKALEKLRDKLKASGYDCK